MAGCAHLVPANWRAFEGDVPPLKPIVISTLVALGLTVVPDSKKDERIITQWQYANPDALTRERHRMVVYWKLEPADQSVVLYVQHENQSIESSLEGGVDFQPTNLSGQKVRFATKKSDSPFWGDFPLEKVGFALLGRSPFGKSRIRPFGSIPL